MKLELLGVRGSTAAPGAEFARFGGHTSCVAVTAAHADSPTLALDAGTGLRRLSDRLHGRAYEGAILLSHLHWDHMQGLPFFAAGDRDGSRVDVYVPAQDGSSGRDLLAQTLSPPAFPIGRLTRIDAPAGTMVVREGDAGDRFYVIESGALDAAFHGEPLSSMGPGECFGEIALLHDVPRTASVVARDDCVLYALERDDFLAAMAGDHELLTRAEALAARRIPTA